MAQTFDNLAPGPGCRLLLLGTPARSEQLEALRRWAAGRGIAVAWVHLAAADNEPTRFVARVQVELERAIGRSLGTAGPDGVDLLNALAGLLTTGLALVLENYDAIEASDVHGIVQLMLDYPPPGLLLVIMAETTPPLELARLRARRQLKELS
jgi:ATP/maltotriose-dependent transcriptional regulator MalT